MTSREERAIYLRHSTIRKDGKTHVDWRLVRSVRRGGKVVQETVAQLGELDAQGRGRARDLARQITGRGDQAELFEEPTERDERIAVRLDEVRLERGLRFGDVWLGWTLWKALRFDEVFAQVLPPGREEVPWAVMSSVLVPARLSEPSSELHIAEDWYRKTALEDLLGLAAEKVNEDRLYRALDQILPHKAADEQHIRRRLRDPCRHCTGAWLGAAATMDRTDRVGATDRGVLHPESQRLRMVLGRSVESLHPAHGSRGGLPHPQDRPVDPTHLAPEG